MTKLVEWLSVLVPVLVGWLSIVCGYIKSPVLDSWMNLIILSPIIFVGLFGLYAAIIVLYRVFTFNNCDDAAKELLGEIEEAKKDLEAKGLYR